MSKFNSDDVPTALCPECRSEQEDFDGFGVLMCANCGWCQHASITDDQCSFCGGRIVSEDQQCPKCREYKVRAMARHSGMEMKCFACAHKWEGAADA